MEREEAIKIVKSHYPANKQMLNEALEFLIPELKKSEDEKIRKDIIVLVKDWWDRVNKDNISTKEQMLAWLKKQKATDKEIIFRALPGTDIIVAAKQAFEKIEIGKEIILAFNGAYIPVNGKTVADICNEYFAWHEKQGEQKVPINDFKAKNWYVSEVDGNIHDMTYNPSDKIKPKFKIVEYVYILDYCSGRVIVAKHDTEESIETLFDKLGLKESQCHYMVSDKILSIEYINF